MDPVVGSGLAMSQSAQEVGGLELDLVQLNGCREDQQPHPHDEHQPTYDERSMSEKLPLPQCCRVSYYLRKLPKRPIFPY